MSPELLGLVGFVCVLILMFSGMHVGIAMGLVGFVGYMILAGGSAFQFSGILIPSAVGDFNIALLPIFLLMGEFASSSGMMSDFYKAANVWLGRLPGGLVLASLTGSAGFSAVTGSSFACAAVMTRIALPGLLEHKYKPSLALGALAAGGTLGSLIPPGFMYIFYAILSGASIGQLYIATVIPGIVLYLMYMAQVSGQCIINPSIGPPAEGTTWGQKISHVKYFVPLIITFSLIIGGLQFGIFTTFEAAAASAVFVFCYALFRRRVTKKSLLGSFQAALSTTGMAFLILVGAKIFTAFIALSGIPTALGSWVVAMNMSTLTVIIAIMFIYIILGMIMDSFSMVMLTLPIFIALLRFLHVDLIWFGVLVVIQMEMALITPPVGMNLFIMGSMVKSRGISMGTIYKGVLPFSVTIFLFNVLILFFPSIATWLPSLMK